jgi:predicted ABC-type ATPase
VCGPNGCGKSTFARKAAGTARLLGTTAIDPDDLTREALRDDPSHSLSSANIIGVERAEKAVWRAIAEGASVAIETVLSSDKFLPIVAAARRRRFHSRLVFVALPSVSLAIARVMARVADGGHDVPEARIRSRWTRSHINLRRFAYRVDDLFVFSNAALDKPLLIAERIGRHNPAKPLTEPPKAAVRRLAAKLQHPCPPPPTSTT